MKRIFCIILAVLMVFSAFAVAGVASAQPLDSGLTATSDEATKDEEPKPLPEKPDGTNRYFFYMPEYWKENNPYTQTVGIYWWEGTDNCGINGWPGYEAKKADVEGVYYYDVPKDVSTIIWSNFVDGGMDDTQDIYTLDYHTDNINSEFYLPGESELYPNGTESYDDMIYVLDLSKTTVNELSDKKLFLGEWFYYYGGGEYGLAKEKANAKTILSGDNVTLSELSPEEEATESATSAPTAPPVQTYRYYFYLPKTWTVANPYYEAPAIYWWDGSNPCEDWPGYELKKADAEGVYYYDVPEDVCSIVWNNGVDGGTDSKAPVYIYAYHTVTIASEFYEPGENGLYPEGVENFDEMIYVIDLNDVHTQEMSGKQIFGGEWFYYYGNGEYGVAENKADAKAVYSSDTIILDDVYFDQNASVPAQPSEPEETSLGADATEVTVPTEPEKSSAATVATDPTEAPQPTQTSVVTEPAETTEATKASETTEITEVTQTAATKATEPATETTVLTETTEVTKVTEATEATEASAEATVPTQSTEATESSTENSTEATETTSSVDELVPYLMGDADLNGKVNVKDATLIQKHAAKIAALEGDSKVTADVNGDGKINVKDATVIQKFVAKIEIDFVVGEIVKKEVLF
ncbi:MAG: hypothetical protein IJZ54_04000 [Clostridia bacterium]|nr:hypothetical protein [Clostridia bacterium]